LQGPEHECDGGRAAHLQEHDSHHEPLSRPQGIIHADGYRRATGLPQFHTNGAFVPALIGKLPPRKSRRIIVRLTLRHKAMIALDF
jgi:hypothetical protein